MKEYLFRNENIWDIHLSKRATFAYSGHTDVFGSAHPFQETTPSHSKKSESTRRQNTARCHVTCLSVPEIECERRVMLLEVRTDGVVPDSTVRWISAAAPRGNNFQTDQTLQQASSNNTAEWMTNHTLKSVTLRRCYISIVSFTTGHYVLLGPQSKLTWGEILFAASWPCESFNNNTFSLGVSGGRFTKPLSH